MKLNKLFMAALSIAAIALASCGGHVPDIPTGPGSGTNPTDPTDTTHIDVPAGDTITIAKALEILSGMEAKAETEKAYYILGEVSYVLTAADKLAEYGNCNFKITDESDKSGFSCFYMNYLNNEKFTDASQIPVVGDQVTVYGKLKNYVSGEKITPEMTNGYIVAIKKGEHKDPTLPEGVVGDGTQANPFTVADLVLMNNTYTGTYFAKGILVGQVKNGATSMTAETAEWAAPFTGADGSNTNILIAGAANTNDIAQVVAVQLPAGYLRDALNLVAHPENLGKEVIIYGSLEKYFGTVGVKNMTRAFINGQEIVLEIGDEPTATVATVAEFNAAPINSTKEGVYYELTGTIGGTINTTYGNFDLTDATGTVYVYGLTASYLPLSSATKANNDKSYASLNLKEGDNITIRGVRADYNGKVEVLGAYFVKKN